MVLLILRVLLTLGVLHARSLKTRQVALRVQTLGDLVERLVGLRHVPVLLHLQVLHPVIGPFALVILGWLLALPELVHFLQLVAAVLVPVVVPRLLVIWLGLSLPVAVVLLLGHSLPVLVVERPV